MSFFQRTSVQAPTLPVLPGNATHQGKRQEQQDSFRFTRFDDLHLIRHGGIMAVVADGMGGLSGGAYASRSAVDAMRAGYESKADWEPVPDALLRALGRANRAVYEVAARIDSEGHCGTTLVAAVIHEGRLYWVSVGDSRLYILREDQLIRLTDDHNREQELERELQAGRITPADKLNDPQLNALVSWIGLRDLPEICVNEHGMPLQEGDRVLLCTDGLYNTLSEQEMSLNLTREDPQDAAEGLIAAVVNKDHPHQDNVTVIVLGIDA